MKTIQRIIILLMILVSDSSAQQITINRIEQMPNTPSPYLMRDWKQVARGYDSLVFDFNRTGTYMPLGRIVTNNVNYPNHNSFGLYSYVGTNSPNSREAINCLPAVVGATLAGIDKSNQSGRNYALMAEEWFNRRPSQNVYKNGPVDDSGDDFWYETMPNVFFYQLNALYPNTGDYNYQFTTVADRWLEAVRVMGGSTTPWRKPNVNHRGWFLQTMTPYDAGVPEPEAAGALAWLFYNAFVKTDSAKYRIGAEWAMEFLDSYGSNPSYELQLSYGTYLAARMNAELGTTYNIERMVNWCFDVGPLRSWGAIVGNWGGYDVSGLIGEVNGSNDYAFAMNTFEQASALVPMVRYDDRFARAIGKWVLNAANAARLFYSNYLPDSLQDSRQWAHQYDPTSSIAYEALRQSRNNVTPFATGDAIGNGWAQTNLGLYGSSHVGIFAGIIDTTNVPMILRLDALKTDYYHAPAYPTYLYFNPYAIQKTVSINVGSGQHDLYDAVTNTFLRTGVSGATTFNIPVNSAALVVITPAGGTITYSLDKMLVNGIVVDYRSGQVVANYPPRIKSLSPEASTILLNGSTQLYCTAADRNNDTLAYNWQVSQGVITGSGSNVVWTAPNVQGDFTITCIVDDGHGGRDTARTSVQVVASINHAPTISRVSARPRKINLNSNSQARCTASDPDGDSLTYSWSSNAGVFTGSGSSVVWTAPSIVGNFVLYVTVNDGRGGLTRDSIRVEVRDFSQTQTGELVAYYPFNGNANDESSHGNNGTVHGATLVADRRGMPNSAYVFDGNTNYIEVPNSSSLNFQQSTTINFWMKIGTFYEREQYPISHGNWENRLKVSISNRRLRWTVKTTTGIKDVDSETELVTDTWYNITALYSGSDFEVYLNGEMDAFTSWSGTILPTTIALTIGQVLPNNQSYNFNGVLDDIRIYNYALSVDSIQALAGGTTAVDESDHQSLPTELVLEQNFPNPFNSTTEIRYQISEVSHVKLKVYDVLGRAIATLADGVKAPGLYSVTWDASNVASGIYIYRLTVGSYTASRKMLLLR
jgi:hypothetical protein